MNKFSPNTGFKASFRRKELTDAILKIHAIFSLNNSYINTKSN